MEEIWKDIEGYEGFYQVSNLGNVKSLNYAHRGYQKNLVPKCNNSGRLWVELVKHGAKKPMLIHRLVAMAFIPNPCNLPQINHRDENPKNNNVNNLEWCDQLYNNRYSLERHPERKIASIMRLEEYRNKWKRSYRTRGKGCTWKNGPHDKRKVDQLSKDNDHIMTWNSVAEASKKNHWNYSSIKECCEGKRHTAYGFKWRFVI